MKFNVTISQPSPLLALGSLLFNGTAIWLHGDALRMTYTVQLDEVPFSTTDSSGFLFIARNLSDANVHSLAVQPASQFKSATVEMDLDADLSMVVDDGQLWNLTPAEGKMEVTGEWTANQCLGAGRSEGTCHTSQGTGGTITYTFQADGLTIWGSLESVRSRYTISIDGSTPKIYSTNEGTLEEDGSVVLAHASNLGPGTHTITIFNTPLDGESRMEIDYLKLYTTSGAAAASSSDNVSKGGVVAIVIGILAGLAVAALAIFGALWWRRKQQHKNDLAEASFIDNATSYSGSMMFRHTHKDIDTDSIASIEKPPRARTATPTTAFDAPWEGSRHSIHPMGESDFDATVAGRKSPLAFLSRWRK